MPITDTVDGYCMCASMMAPLFLTCLILLIHFEDEKIGGGVVFAALCTTLLNVFLTNILKYRAAHHRKIRRWKTLDNEANNEGQKWVYLRELFRCEAKITPIYSMPLTETFNLLWYAVVGIVFPLPIALFYFATVTPSSLSVFVGLGGNPGGFNILVYNGRRHSRVSWGIYYGKLEDENHNTAYFPIRDLGGLIPFKN